MSDWVQSAQTYPAPAGGQAATRAADPATDIGQTWRAISGRWRSILLITAGFIALALLYVFTATPLYTAGTAMLYDPRTRGVLTQDSQVASLSVDAALVDSQVKLLGSETILRRVVETERLLTDPEFGDARPGLRSVVLTMLGLRRETPAPTAEERTNGAVDALGKAVAVRRSERTYIIEVDVTARDPQKAARLANAVAKAFMDDQMEARIDSARREGSRLRGRLDELQARVRDAERRVEAFRQANRIVSANGRLVDDQSIEEVNEQLATARQRTTEARARLDQIQRALRSGQPADTSGEALRSGTIERLRTQIADIIRQEASLRRTLGPRHPSYLEVQQQLQESRTLLAEELRRIAQGAAAELQIARDAEAGLQRQLDQLKQASSRTSENFVELRELEREVEASKSVYERFLRARETIGQDPLESVNLRIIANATPPTGPSFPRRLPILAIAAFCGLALGVARALLLDFLGTPPASPADQPQATAATTPTGDVLATLPALGRPWRQRLGTLLQRLRPGKAGITQPEMASLAAAALQPETAFAETLRRLFLAFDEAGMVGTQRTLLVTSLEAGSGKTTLAANLAWAGASLGRRCLLIDAHRGNPTLTTAAPAGAATASLGLFGRQSRVRLLGPDWASGPVLLPLQQEAGQDEPQTPAPSADADAPGLEGPLAGFDLIIVDAPPLSREASLAALAAASDDVVLVLPAPLAKEQVQARLRAAGIATYRFRGVVVNPAAR